MSDRQTEKFKRRIENRLEEVQNKLCEFGRKTKWTALDTCEYNSLLEEATDLRLTLQTL